MKSEQQNFGELASGLILNTLPKEERRLAQELVMDNPEFLKVLRLELSLKNNVASLKKPISDSLKKRVYLNVTASANELLYKKIFQTVLKSTLPTLAWPALQLLERSVFANE